MSAVKFKNPDTGEWESIDIIRGPRGPQGDSGKSAYEYAKDGGYTGTKDEFAQDLATDYIPSPTTAIIGQTMVVKEVDEYGKPVSWECVDVPDGGGGSGGETWELINDSTVEEDISKIDTGYWDNPYKKLRIVVDTLAAETNTNYSPVRIWIENDNSANHPSYDVDLQWYPPAIPTTSVKQSVWEISAEYLGEDIFVIFASMNKGEVDKMVHVNPAERYYKQKATNKIYRLSINTYATFVTGTRLRIWGVRA